MPATAGGGHFSRRDRDEYERLSTLEDIMSYRPNREPPRLTRISASRLPAILEMVEDKLTYPRGTTTATLRRIARETGISFHPGHVAGNLTVVCPNWLSSSVQDCRSDFVSSLGDHQAQTAWCVRRPEMCHQLRFVMHHLPGAAIRHAGIALLVHQHKTVANGKALYFFEPMANQTTIPQVVRQWAVLEGITEISLIQGTQRRASIQCIRFTLEWYWGWLRTNQTLPPMGATYRWSGGVVQPIAQHQRPRRQNPAMPARYQDDIVRSAAEGRSDTTMTPVVNLGPRI
jgi:hypothetical protein